MADHGRGNDDPEIIAPVSSLRSKFESLAKTKTAPPAPPTPSQPQLARNNTLPVPAEPDRGRASLDSPRSQPWEAAETRQGRSQTTVDVPKPVVTDRPRRGPSPRQRPVSMFSPFSPLPQSPPVVNVESPMVSPPNSGGFNRLTLPLQISTSSSAPFDPAARSPLRTKPAPPPPPASKNKPTGGPTSAGPVLVPPSLPSPGLKKQPPPINRSNKPSTPTTLAPPSLDLKKDGLADSTSPFNTPPSSDDSPGKASLPSIRQRPNDADRTTNKTYFPPPPSHHTIEARRGSSAPLGAMYKTPRDRQASAPNTLYHPSDSREERPQLPARTPKEKSPARASRALTPDRNEVGRRKTSPRTPMQPPHASKGRSASEFLPPPRRIPARRENSPAKSASTIKASVPARSVESVESSSRASSAQGQYSDHEPPVIERTANASDSYPDATRTNRRPPIAQGAQQIYLHYDTRQFDLCGRYCCTVGYYARIYDTSNGRMLFELSNPDREFKTTALAFKPGATTEQEGQVIWLGNNYGEIQEVDIPSQQVIRTKSNAHNAREIIKMYRFQNSIWSVDEDGRLHVWNPDDKGVPSLQKLPDTYRVSRGHTFSLVVKGYLWYACGKEIRVYNPSGGENHFHMTLHPLHQASAGEVTSGAVISSQLDRVYFGHSDGKISIYSTADYSCLALVSASSYKINCLAGSGNLLWAGFGTGRVYVYDTRQQPWLVRKDWQAHLNPVSAMLVDKSTAWTSGRGVVASIGLDKTICLWDGWLEDDFFESDLQEHDVEYCDFREIKAVVITWNAGASTPGTLRAEDRNANFFREIIQTHDPPDLLVFGFQELVDLEDKKLTAKSFFKGTRKKEHPEHDHMSRQYREWRDYLARVLEDYMPAEEPYTQVSTTHLVGLFSCVFVKSSQRAAIRDVQTTEVKRGLGGLHGNKGALILRFIFDDSSLCFANCHLAAGQSHTAHRNEDITAILEAASLPRQTELDRRIDHFVGGGDGSMMMDHEICVINGDLNYRIDTMGRDTVIKAIRSGNLSRLLERDQLLVSKRRNPAFRLRAFAELPIAFAPTYKYDVGTDTYDTSEKSRSPAWCDRILFRGVGRVKQLQYRRHEGLRMSDHRPVSGTFAMRVKHIDPAKRDRVRQQSEHRLVKEKQRLAADARLDYLVNVLGVSPKEANQLVAR